MATARDVRLTCNLADDYLSAPYVSPNDKQELAAEILKLIISHKAHCPTRGRTLKIADSTPLPELVQKELNQFNAWMAAKFPSSKRHLRY